jgi:hypothetical protein
MLNQFAVKGILRGAYQRIGARGLAVSQGFEMHGGMWGFDQLADGSHIGAAG